MKPILMLLGLLPLASCAPERTGVELCSLDGVEYGAMYSAEYHSITFENSHGFYTFRDCDAETRSSCIKDGWLVPTKVANMDDALFALENRRVYALREDDEMTFAISCDGTSCEKRSLQLFRDCETFR